MGARRRTAGTGKAPKPEEVAPAPQPRGRAQNQGLQVKAPATVVRDASAEPPTEVRPEPPFFYAWHPRRLKVADGRVVPHFIRLSAEPGVGGVGLQIGRNGQRIPVVEQAKAIAKEKGLVVLEWNIDEPDFSSYIAQDPRTGGWFDRFSAIFSGSDAIDYDEKGFADWCESLYERGIIPRPQIWSMRRYLGDLQTALSKQPKDSPDRLELGRQIKAVQAELKKAIAEDDAAKRAAETPTKPAPSAPAVG